MPFWYIRYNFQDNDLCVSGVVQCEFLCTEQHKAPDGSFCHSFDFTPHEDHYKGGRCKLSEYIGSGTQWGLVNCFLVGMYIWKQSVRTKLTRASNFDVWFDGCKIWSKMYKIKKSCNCTYFSMFWDLGVVGFEVQGLRKHANFEVIHEKNENMRIHWYCIFFSGSSVRVEGSAVRFWVSGFRVQHLGLMFFGMIFMVYC